MVKYMKETVAGQGFEKSRPKEQQLTELGMAKDRETGKGPMGVAAPDNSLTGMNRNGNETEETFGLKRRAQVSRMTGACVRRKEGDLFWDIDRRNTHVAYRNQPWSLIIALMTSR